MPNKFAFSGRLRAGKDFTAHALGCSIISVADPMYVFSEHFMGSADKDQPHIRKFLQTVGMWGRGKTTEAPEGLPSRAEVTSFIRSSAQTILSQDYADTDWTQFGKDESFWITSALRRIDRITAVDPTAKLAIVNARFESELAAFEKAGFLHLHVKCSDATRIERIGPEYDPKMEDDITEQMAKRLDVPGAIDDAKVVWNDHRPQPVGAQYLSVAEMVVRFSSHSLPEPAPLCQIDTSHERDIRRFA